MTSSVSNYITAKEMFLAKTQLSEGQLREIVLVRTPADRCLNRETAIYRTKVYRISSGLTGVAGLMLLIPVVAMGLGSRLAKRVLNPDGRFFVPYASVVMGMCIAPLFLSREHYLEPSDPADTASIVSRLRDCLSDFKPQMFPEAADIRRLRYRKGRKTHKVTGQTLHEAAVCKRVLFPKNASQPSTLKERLRRDQLSFIMGRLIDCVGKLPDKWVQQEFVYLANVAKQQDYSREIFDLHTLPTKEQEAVS